MLLLILDVLLDIRSLLDDIEANVKAQELLVLLNLAVAPQKVPDPAHVILELLEQSLLKVESSKIFGLLE